MNQNQQIKNTEKGRSLVEMLGVLAIIGVLSIAGVAGYRAAMTQYRANETINDVMIWAASVRGISNYQNQEQNAGEYDFSSLGTTTQTGYPIYASIQPEENAEGLFQIIVEDVPNDVCQKIIEMRPEEINAIKASGYKNTTTSSLVSCQSPDNLNEMLFIFEYPPPCQSLCHQWYNDWLENCSEGSWSSWCVSEPGFYCKKSQPVSNESCPSGHSFSCRGYMYSLNFKQWHVFTFTYQKDVCQ